jgi:beta-N-acetylhexosaminidase
MERLQREAAPVSDINGGASSVLSTLLPGFEGTTLPPWLAARLRSGLGGVCLFAGNITSLAQLRDLTDAIYAANPRAVVAVDEEGGDVTRLFARAGSPYPGNALLGRIDDVNVTRMVANDVGWQLRRVGCNVDFAPSVDVNSNAANPVIGVRSFGAASEHVAAHSAEWVTGLQSTGVAASAKHFPGHGDTAQDSHVALPVIDRSPDELRQRELVPFIAAIQAGTHLVMTSHIMLPQLDAENPATLSPAILTGLLREELGFGGVVVSDALDMAGAASPGGMPETAVRALRAGCDLLCLGTDNADLDLMAIEEAVGAAIAEGRLDPGRVDQAAGRVLALADELAALRPPVSHPSELVQAAIWPENDRELIAAFDVQPTAQTWQGFADPFSVVRLEARPNIAAGLVPWGPFAAVAEEPDTPHSAAFAAHPQFEVTGEDSTLPPASADTPVLVLGRDIHRHAFARAVVDRLRAAHASLLVVDMGWPSEDRRYADVATFGASRLVGRAVLSYLAGETGTRP